jgi:hypothetical protein
LRLAGLNYMTSTPSIAHIDERNERHELNESLLSPVIAELDSIRGIAILAVLFYHELYWDIDIAQFSKHECLPSLFRSCCNTYRQIKF